MQKPKYKIPKNLCQICYQISGRYILDCYCIICQQCYSRFPPKGPTCTLCGRATKGNKIDAKQQSSIKKIGHLFQNVDVGIQKVLEIYKFQNQITNRYCQHLERELMHYQSAVNQLVSANPGLYNYFVSRVKLKKSTQQTQQIQRNHSVSIKGETTIKPGRQYASQIFQSRRTTLQMNGPSSNYKNMQPMVINGVRPIGKNQQNHSGNVVYKVPNINYNTATRSSQRVIRDHNRMDNRMGQDGYEDFQNQRRRQY